MAVKSALSFLLLWSMTITILPLSPSQVLAQNQEGEVEHGLRFRLSEGVEKSEVPTPKAAVESTRLSESETAALLARLPKIQITADDTADFKLRENSLPPPRAGQTITAAFAPASTGPTAPASTKLPLAVVRFTPEGEVAIAPSLSITFSQPMVAVSSQEEAAASVPVTLSPQPSGKWRWLGTQTLVFQPDAEGGRLPMATRYSVTIPAGTTSALGNKLAQSKTFTVATPPPTLKSSFPAGQSVRRDALMFLEFDQRIDPKRVLEHLKVQPASAELRLRIASAEEIAADPTVSDLVKRAQEGRWLVLRAVGPNGQTKDALPSNTSIKLIISPGTPSAEGDRTTTTEQSFTFQTFGPLQVVTNQCGYQEACSPFDYFTFVVSNQLDDSAFQPSQVKITPEIPDVKITASYNNINIGGTKQSNTTYTVTLDRAIKDIFGQQLSGNNQFVFNVKTAPPRLFSTGTGLVVLDPAGRRTFPVYSVNVPQIKVSLYRVGPEDWLTFRTYLGSRYNNPNQTPPRPGQLISDNIVDIKAATDQLIETAIDLSAVLDEGYGHVFVHVEPVDRSAAKVNVYARRQNIAEAWVQSTQIGLDAFVDHANLLVWANSLQDGSALSGVNVSVSPDDLTGTTGTDGLARLAFKNPQAPLPKQPALIVARRGKDSAILPQAGFSPYYYYPDGENRSWRHTEAQSALRWYVFDDRKLYRPGEEVNVKGWIRNVVLTPTGDTEMLEFSGSENVSYVLVDSQGNEIKKGSARLNALAGFDFKVSLPATMNLGGAHFKLQLNDGAQTDHYFQVQEFRRPEFEITTQASEAPHFVGDFATVTTTAAYYSGGGLAGTDVDWKVLSRPTNYTPPNRDDYTFGKFFPWWRERSDHGETKEQSFTGRTNAEGKHTLRIDFDGVNPPRPSSVSAEARVQDVNRQTLAGAATMLVHPADVYVGLKSARMFVQKGDPFNVAVIVTDLDGKAIAGRDVSLRLVRLDYVFEKGEWKQQEKDPQETSVNSLQDAVNVRFHPKEGGMYSLVARVRDERERLNETELSLWVAGGKAPPKREVEQEEVQLIPDRKTYAGGEVAEILVQSPFAPAEGVLTIRRSGLLRTERFSMNGSSHTLRVPLAEAMTPNIYVQVDLVGSATRVDDEGNDLPKLPKRPAFATGEIKLEIPPTSRRLSVKATPRETVLEPGAETIVDIEVKDASGRSVAGTDTAIVVVDESVLALTGFKLEDPLRRFYEERSESVFDHHLRDKVKLADPKLVAPAAGDGAVTAGLMMMSEMRIQNLPASARKAQNLMQLDSYGRTETVSVMSDGAEPEISVRQNFDALAIFVASLPTDERGHAQVKVKLPDNLTRYRVMAVSVSGGKLAGSGESAITARKQLMARPSAPRFLNYGDTADLPVVLQNQTNQMMSVSVAVRATNAEMTAGAGRRVNVPANDRVEVLFPIAAMKPGLARFQIAASSGARVDAAEVALPVYTPATTEAFATYGVIDSGSIAQPVKAPADAVKTFGGLEITTASTQLQELTDAVIYLYNYPFGCAEQIASRVISIAALKDVLTAFNTKDLPSPEAMRTSVNADLKALQGLQNDDGGFGFWRQGERSFPYVSVHVAHALARAKSKDFTVPEQTLSNSDKYLRNIEQRIPADYSPESRRAIQAYALYVRMLMKDRDAAKARKLLADGGGVEKFSLESLGWLLPVLSGDAASAVQVEAIRRHLNNRVTETAAAAHFADSYSDGAFTILHSNRRADGVILEALIGDQPQSDLIPKLVRGLLSGRDRGRWTNTQENVFILLALDRYFSTYESATPNFVARVWLGKGYAGEQLFKGRSIDRQQINLPMPLLLEQTAAGPANLTIAKEGPGRLYFRVGAKYAPANLKLAAADYGFVVQRKYEAIDDPADVQLEPDGTWSIKAGARIRVRLTMSNPARRYHVALVDPLPAGLEALNPELATTERLPAGSSETATLRRSGGVHDYYSYWRGTWYEHQNMRDERAEAFASLLWEGVHEYSYFARATTPGLFVVPPTKAEEMYAPETFGRGKSDRVRVK